jgi:regulatory protein
MADGRRRTAPDQAAAGRVARLDEIDGGGEGGASAPVAQFGELLGTATPGWVDGSPVPVAPADLRQAGVPGSASTAPVADFAAPATADSERASTAQSSVPVDRQSADAGTPGPVSLFDSPSLGAGRDVAVAEFGSEALERRPTRSGRRRTGSGAERGNSRRAGRGVRRAGDDSDRSGDRGAQESPGAIGRDSRRRRASPVDAPDRPTGDDPARHAGESAGREVDEPRSRQRSRQHGRRGRGHEELDPDADPVAAAREICLRLLTDRARTRQELAQALRRKGVPDDAASTVLERFDEVGLIDDAAFAGQWVRSRHSHRGLARRAIAMELRRKGVSDEDAGEALAEVDAESEERRARELVDRKLRSLTVGTAEQRATAGRRLVGMLARKGYGAGIAYRVVKEALAERGAEADELGDGEIVED